MRTLRGSNSKHHLEEFRPRDPFVRTHTAAALVQHIAAAWAQRMPSAAAELRMSSAAAGLRMSSAAAELHK